MQNHILNFDKVIMKSIFGNREKRFNEKYRNHTLKHNQENSTSSHKLKSRIGGASTVGMGTTLQSSVDFKNDKIGYDSDNERQNAHQMFIDDIQKLRQYFKNTLEE